MYCVAHSSGDDVDVLEHRVRRAHAYQLVLGTRAGDAGRISKLSLRSSPQEVPSALHDGG